MGTAPFRGSTRRGRPGLLVELRRNARAGITPDRDSGVIRILKRAVTATNSVLLLGPLLPPDILMIMMMVQLEEAGQNTPFPFPESKGDTACPIGSCRHIGGQ